MTASGRAASVEPGSWMSSRPTVRSTVAVGPLLLEGTRTVRIVADRVTGGYLRLGEREAFLLEHLDGRRTLTEVGSLYAQRFGRRLDSGHWQQILTLFGRHALLEPVDQQVLVAARERVDRAREEARRGPFLYRLPIPGAVGVARTVAPYVSWTLHPLVVVLVTVAGVGASVALAWDWRALLAAADGSPQRWSSVLLAVVLTWALIALHELGHATACVRYGGTPTEIGLMWRVPFLTPYCKVDDVVTFPRRGQRVMTAFAGVYVNLAAQPVLLLVWTQGDPQGWAGAVLAFVVLGNSACIVVNLLPVLQLDGYHMVEHATGSVALQRETLRFVSGAVRERSTFVDRYEPRARWTYSSYALLALFLLGPMVATMVGSWYVTMADLWGPAVSAGILVAEAALIVLLVRWGMAWNRRRAAATPATALTVPTGPSDVASTS